MRGPAAALNAYLNGFNLPAYTTESLPKEAEPPYITYPLNIPTWDEKTSFYIQIWFRTRSNEALLTKADEILADIGPGKILQASDGYVAIWPETPAVQLLVDGDTRSAYLNLSINAYQKPGAYAAPEDPEEGEPE